RLLGGRLLEAATERCAERLDRSNDPGVRHDRRPLADPRPQAGQFAAALFTISPKPLASATAMSARTLRSRSMFAFLSECMRREYDVPLRRAAALMRAIQRRRKSRLRSLRWAYAYTHDFITTSFAYAKRRERAL